MTRLVIAESFCWHFRPPHMPTRHGRPLRRETPAYQQDPLRRSLPEVLAGKTLVDSLTSTARSMVFGASWQSATHAPRPRRLHHAWSRRGRNSSSRRRDGKPRQREFGGVVRDRLFLASDGEEPW